MIEHIINKLILTVGTWNATGQKDKRLESQFNALLGDLRMAARTTPEGAVQMLLESLGEKEAATA